MAGVEVKVRVGRDGHVVEKAGERRERNPQPLPATLGPSTRRLVAASIDVGLKERRPRVLALEIQNLSARGAELHPFVPGVQRSRERVPPGTTALVVIEQRLDVVAEQVSLSVRYCHCTPTGSTIAERWPAAGTSFSEERAKLGAVWSAVGRMRACG